AVLDVEPIGGLVRTKFESDFRAEAKAFGPEQHATIQWSVDNQPLGNSKEVPLDPTSPDQTTQRDHPQFTTGGPHLIAAEVRAPGDRLPLDNTRYHVEDVASDLHVLLVE